MTEGSSGGHTFTEQFSTSNDNKSQHLLGARSAPDKDQSIPWISSWNPPNNCRKQMPLVSPFYRW